MTKQFTERTGEKYYGRSFSGLCPGFCGEGGAPGGHPQAGSHGHQPHSLQAGPEKADKVRPGILGPVRTAHRRNGRGGPENGSAHTPHPGGYDEAHRHEA